MYQCCFCGESISRKDAGAVSIGIWTIQRKDPPGQNVLAHNRCLAEKFGPTLHPSVPFDAEAFLD